MKRKTIIICLIVLIIAVLWISGVIPMFILKTIGARNMQKEYPEWKLKFESAEYDEAFGDYLITMIDLDGNRRSCLIGPEWFPRSLGQGSFALHEEYSNWCRENGK